MIQFANTTLPQDLSGHLSEVAAGCQQMLAENPCHPQALVGITLVALASGQSAAAVKMARAAVASAPRMPAAWVALGQALKAAKRDDEAERAYIHAAGLDGRDALCRLGLGELRLAAGDPRAAIEEFERALALQPALVAAQMGMGHTLAMLERNEEALACYEQARAMRKKLPEANFASGFVLARMGRIKEAEARYRRALVERPDFAAAWINLGSLLREQGRDLFAESALRRAIQLRPDLVSGWVNLAILERERHQPDKAAACLRRAFELNPEQVETHVAWCQHCSAEGDAAGAWGWLRWALTREPDNAEAINMHGILLYKERRFAESIAIFEQAEALGHRAAASNRGNSLMELGRQEEALQAQKLAVERDPLCYGARYNLALTRLRLGEWREGWPEYEARWRFREVHRSPRRFSQPRWHGEALDGRRILLHAEQGLGDTIQFCRYANVVAELGGTAILQVQEPVFRLMQSLDAVHAGRAETALLDARSPHFDLECPLMSLPSVFATTVESAPWCGAYLGADAALEAEKRAKFPDDGRSHRVGLAWAGNPKYKADAQRSVKLATLLPLLRARTIQWIALQKGEAAAQLAELPGDVSLLDGSSGDRDLAETAALVSTLDLVITTDTCIAHLAGAMGKPVWILLPHLADWRWMQQIETTPWYPTARLFRQSVPGDWAGVLERVIAELEALPAVHLPRPVRAVEYERERSQLIPA
jgi:tetratricopeptide (TPR) repeat protein